MRVRVVGVLLALLLVAVAAARAGRFLVVDQPRISDAILVLAGETKTRPARALELLGRGMARAVVLDAEDHAHIYDLDLVTIARQYAAAHDPQGRVSVCAIRGYSTIAETVDADRCLRALGAHRVLIVTSEFHTRRALMVFRHRLPGYEFSAAAAYNSAQFGEAWWRNREWAKTTLDEWMKLAWFEAVDRWRA